MVKVGYKKWDEREENLFYRKLSFSFTLACHFLNLDIFCLWKSVSYISSSGQYFTPICISMAALRAQPRWPLYGLTFRNIFLFSTRLFYSLRNEGKDTRLKGESRRLAPSSHPSALRQRSFRLRHGAPPTDCDVEVMPISLATWVLIVTFHYGQWQRGDPQPHLEDVTQGPMRRRQSWSDLEMSEHCAWDDTQILHPLQSK